MPEAGETLCALKNNHDLGILNGTRWRVSEADSRWEPGDDTVYVHIQLEEGGVPMGTPMDAHLFYNDQEKPAWSNNEQFTFGYALTVHKSQGSEFNNVVGFDDWPSNRSYKEWLYTLITRASERLTLVVS